MEERDEQKLEGLLKARSADMGRRRRRRQRPPELDPGFERRKPVSEPETVMPPARPCGDCGTDIHDRRLRAMPSATRCLDCQRAFETARAGV